MGLPRSRAALSAFVPQLRDGMAPRFSSVLTLEWQGRGVKSAKGPIPMNRERVFNPESFRGRNPNDQRPKKKAFGLRERGSVRFP
jgi:hypothetical protein